MRFSLVSVQCHESGLCLVWMSVHSLNTLNSHVDQAARCSTHKNQMLSVYFENASTDNKPVNNQACLTLKM